MSLPTTRAEQLEFASKLHGIPVDNLVVGIHIGPEEPNGVGTPTDFDGYTPYRRIDNPTDGWNNGAKYVVYFHNNEGAIFKAINADPASLVQLHTGPEFEFASNPV